MSLSCFSRSAVGTCLESKGVPLSEPAGLPKADDMDLFGVCGQPGEAGNPRRISAAFVGVLNEVPEP